MAERMDSLFRRGLISPKAMEKLGKRRSAKPKGFSATGVQPAGMADFDDKRGVRDQGGVRDRGARVAGSRHIDRTQDLGSPARASGRPSKGGFVVDEAAGAALVGLEGLAHQASAPMPLGRPSTIWSRYSERP